MRFPEIELWETILVPSLRLSAKQGPDVCGEGQSSLMPHTIIDGHLCPCVVLGIYLHENFILIVERLPVFPVVEGRYPHYLLLLVDDGHGENVLDHPPRIIQGPLLQEQRERLLQVWSGEAWR